MSKFIVLVLDGFGVGYMDDVLEVRARDYGSNTALHILDKVPNSKWSNLEKLSKDFNNYSPSELLKKEINRILKGGEQ